MNIILHSLLLYFFLIPLLLAPLPASALVDDDSDGMSDLWEALYSFSITDTGTLVPAQAPSADPDGDGVNNLSESIAGTNPLSGHGANGILRGALSASTTVPGNFDLAWSQLTGKSYQPQQSSDLTLASWLPMQDAVTATTSGNSIFSFSPVGLRSFYRLGVSDVDPDGDTLSSWEEGRLNTNPYHRKAGSCG